MSHLCCVRTYQIMYMQLWCKSAHEHSNLPIRGPGLLSTSPANSKRWAREWSNTAVNITRRPTFLVRFRNLVLSWELRNLRIYNKSKPPWTTFAVLPTVSLKYRGWCFVEGPLLCGRDPLPPLNSPMRALHNSTVIPIISAKWFTMHNIYIALCNLWSSIIISKCSMHHIVGLV